MWPGATLIMVVNKFVDHQSKLGARRWYDRSVFRFAREFEHLKPTGKRLLHTIYRSLDYLTRNKEAIEETLYYHLQCYGLGTDLVLYDVASSYFEGEHAELAAYGYSRDHRPYRAQIVIGVLPSKQGIKKKWRASSWYWSISIAGSRAGKLGSTLSPPVIGTCKSFVRL